MKDKKYPSGEYAIQEGIRKMLGRAAAPGGKFVLTLGDDAAVRMCRRGETQVLTADTAVEGVHFDLKDMSFEEIGFRAVAANVSDCAAMASLPEAALVQLVFPKDADGLQKKINSMYRGFRQACRKWELKIIGGDLSSGAVWTIGITMLGTSCGRVLRRTGAVPGDALWASGFPGRSAAGLAAIRRWGRRHVPQRYAGLLRAHIRPDPPVKLGVALGRCGKVHAMMDLSDGISKDARTLCHENRLGLQLSLDGIEVPGDMQALGGELRFPLKEWILHGGEEYELLFASSGKFGPDDVPEGFRKGLIRLGVFTDRKGYFVMRELGRTRKIPKRGWDHIDVCN